MKNAAPRPGHGYPGNTFDAAERGHPSVPEHHDLRRQLAQFSRVVADIDHRNAGFVAKPHQIGQDLDLAVFVQRAQRLIQQQQPRLRQQRAAERDALAFAAGEIDRDGDPEPADVEQVGDARFACAGSRARPFMRRP